jgi:mannose-6-phosphate isomerase-like protein (cupin superfamily)
MTIQIIKATDPGEHHVGNEDSSCFYFSPISLAHHAYVCMALFANNGRKDDGGYWGRFARIEVADKVTPLHAHPGATFVIITAGCGIFMTEDGNHEVSPGDMIYVAPGTPHLSVAIPHTTMIEHIVYLGERLDRQSLLPEAQVNRGTAPASSKVVPIKKS